VGLYSSGSSAKIIELFRARWAIHGPSGLGVIPAHELVPCALPTYREGIETVLDEDTGDCGSGDVADAELSQFSENASVPPPSSLGHLDDEPADLLRLSGSARLASFGLRLALAEPAGERPGMDNADQFLDGRAESNAQLAPQDPVVGLQVLDRLDQVFLGRPGNQHQEGVDQARPAGTICKSLVELEVACL
jgi:hypothetical protein